MKLLAQFFSSGDEWMTPYQQRSHIINRYIFIFALCGHSLFIPIFYLLNNALPFYNNLACVLLDLCCLYLNSKRMQKTVYMIFSLEIMYHSFFCNIIFGWGSGFTFYFSAIAFYIFLFGKYMFQRIILASVLAMLFIIQYAYIQTSDPVYTATIIPEWLIYSFNAIASFSAIGFVAYYFQDIVDRAENAITRAKEKAEEGERVKSVFLANISHEIRSPLNSIIGMINLSQLSDDEEKKQEYFWIARDSADHLLTVINDILDYSKMEVCRMTLNFEVFNMHRLIKNTMRSMDSSIYNRKLEMKYEIADGVPLTVKGDPSRIRQVLINLLCNAIKFTESGNITLRCRNTSIVDDSCMLEFEVEDTGSGIPGDKLGTIFDRFTQLDGRVKSDYTGTGLGLAISRELVELMGGTISVKSNPGVGSTFSFTIPLVKADPEEKSISSDAGAGRCGELNILIAEDMFTSWLLYEKYMSILGHSFRIVENGCMVLDELEANSYDLVLMDIEMPDMGGEETLNHIRSGVRGVNRDIPVIALTGYAESDLYNSDSGFNGCVTKPVELHELERAINDAVCEKLKTRFKE